MFIAVHARAFILAGNALNTSQLVF